MSGFKSSTGRLVLGLAVVMAMAFASAARAADTGTVEGKVIGKDGAGVSGAKVRLMKASDVQGGKKKEAPAAAAPAAGEKPKPVAETESGSDGTFSMKDVPAGDYVVNANLKGQGQGRGKVSVKAGETAKVELTLKAGGKKKPA
jgi:hypothetical protein